MSEDLNEKYARLMGMKPEEVREVEPVDDGAVVRTHDEAWTLVRDDGTTAPVELPTPVEPVDGDEARAAMLRGFRGEPEPDAKDALAAKDAPAAKNAPKGRGQA